MSGYLWAWIVVGVMWVAVVYDARRKGKGE